MPCLPTVRETLSFGFHFTRGHAQQKGKGLSVKVSYTCRSEKRRVP
jgi:hypothetical protein